MMFNCMNTAELSDFGTFIKDECEKRKITQTELAELAGLDTGNFSRMLNGKQRVTHRTAEKIADVLRLPISLVKSKAGLRAEGEVSKRDPSVEYIAGRLDKLPDEVRVLLIDSFEAQLNVVDQISESVSQPVNPVVRRAESDPVLSRRADGIQKEI